MSITTLEKLLPHLDVRDLSQLEIHLTKRLALDLLGHLSHSGDLLLWVGVRRRASCVVR